MELSPEDDTCLICFESISIFAFSECGHHTCHRCYLRMRLLYKARDCHFCRAEQRDVIFSETLKPYTYFTKHLLPIFDTETDVYYAQATLKNLVDKITKYACPQLNCQVSFTNWNTLSNHVELHHKLYLCDICIENRTMFPDELQFYTHDQLKWHRKEGDKSFRPADQSGFTGHKECKHCQTFLYGQAEFLAHSRHVHLECFLCKENERSAFFKTYEDLEDHFISDHYICHYSTCLRRKFIVFGSREEWRQHQLALHYESLSTQMNRMLIRNLEDNSPTVTSRSNTMPSFMDELERITPQQVPVITPPTPQLSDILNSVQARLFKRHCWNFNGDYITVQDYIKELYELVRHNNAHVKILLEREAVAYLSNKKRTEAKTKWISYENEISFPVLRSTTTPVPAAGSSTQSNSPRQVGRKDYVFVQSKRPAKEKTQRVLRIVSATKNNPQSSNENSLMTNNSKRADQEIKGKGKRRL